MIVPFMDLFGVPREFSANKGQLDVQRSRHRIVVGLYLR